MANAILHVTTYVNEAGTLFRLRKVEGYGWELHSKDGKGEPLDFYGGFDRMGDAKAYAETGAPLRPA